MLVNFRPEDLSVRPSSKTGRTHRAGALAAQTTSLYVQIITGTITYSLAFTGYEE